MLSNHNWNRAKAIQIFLHPVATIKTKQSVSLHFLISVSFLAFQTLLWKFERVISCADPLLMSFAEFMHCKLLEFNFLVTSEITKLPNSMDSRFVLNIINDSVILKVVHFTFWSYSAQMMF